MPEIVLFTAFVLTLLIVRFRSGVFKYAYAFRVSMSCMLFLTASGHFLFTKGMSLMIPNPIPLKTEIVYLTGWIEIITGITLLIPATRKTTGWFLILFFILILPANIYGAMHHVNMETATFDGEGPVYLWFRIPMQLLFIIWVYLGSLRS